MPKLFDRVKVNIATAGTGTVTFGPASSPAFLTPAEAGAVDGNTVRYVFVDGTDFEEGVGTILASVAQMSRDIVTRSKISGSLGAAKLNLSGTAVLVFTASAADILNPANNLSDLGSAPAARSNLGLGSAATASTAAFLQPGNNLSDVGSTSTTRANLGLGTAAVRSNTDFPRTDVAQTLTSEQQATALKNVGASKGNFNLINGKFIVSAAGGALTVAIKTLAGTDPSATDPVMVPFQDNGGVYSELTITAATSLVIPSGATLAVSSATAFRLWLTGHNDGGTFRLGVSNRAPSEAEIFPLEAFGLAATTAVASGSSGGVFYTGTAIGTTSTPYTVLGYVEWNTSGIAAAGTWTVTNQIRIHLQALGDRLPGDLVRAAYVITAVSTQATTGSWSVTALTKNFTQLSPANINKITYQATCEQSTASRGLAVAFHRDNTQIGPVSVISSNTALIDGSVVGTLLDKPNITGPVTYNPRITPLDGATRVDFNNASYSPRATMVIEELMG